MDKSLRSNAVKVAITLVLVSIAVLHYFLPQVDTFTLALLGLAVLLWFVPWPTLAARIETLKVPGFEIGLREIKEPVEKVLGPTEKSTTADTGELQANETAQVTEMLPKANSEPGNQLELPVVESLEEAEEYYNQAIRLAALAVNPSLALLTLREGIVERLRTIADKSQWGRKPIPVIIERLVFRGAITVKQAEGLKQILELANTAAKGAQVEASAAAWIYDFGPSILAILNNIIQDIDRGVTI